MVRFCEDMAREAWLHGGGHALDFMYFLWCGRLSPLSGREFKTFERALIPDESTWKEPSDPYYRYIDQVETCEMVLREFGLDPKRGHIINGHVPVKVRKGESPVKAGGRAIIIDGGFCKAYHKKTGISGYTLISNSRGLRLLEHQHIANVREALREIMISNPSPKPWSCSPAGRRWATRMRAGSFRMKSPICIISCWPIRTAC